MRASLTDFVRAAATVVALAATGALAGPAEAATIFVAPCGNDGWLGVNPICDAPFGPKQTIQAALAAASDGDTVHVMAGLYLGPVDLGGRAVHLLAPGGPATTTIHGNGTGPVMRCHGGEGPDTIIEGFRITGGDAPANGGGVSIIGSSPTFVGCVITFNHAGQHGGGLAAVLSSPTFDGCAFFANTAEGDGGGAAFIGGNPSFVSSNVVANEAERGGGVAASAGAVLSFASTDVDFNAADYGAGIHLVESQLDMELGDVEGNVARWGGGGIGAFEQSTVTVAGSTFRANESAHIIAVDGGGIFLNRSVGDISFCVFDQNAGGYGGGAVGLRWSDAVIRACYFTGNTSTAMGGAVGMVMSPKCRISQSTFEGNATLGGDRGGGAIGHFEGELVVDRCSFLGNTATNRGGALYLHWRDVTITTSLFADNDAPEGGALYTGEWSEVEVVSCEMRGNTATAGGALFDLGDDTHLINCTLVDNHAAIGSAVLAEGTTRMRNSIAWGNGAFPFTGTGTVEIAYSAIANGWAGPGNIDADPQFVNAGAGDYRLAAGSPCIDAAANHMVPADAPDLDADGNVVERMPIDRLGQPRFADAAGADVGCGGSAIVDMGAHEAAGAAAPEVLVGDIDGDGAVDFADLILVLAAWGPCGDCCPADLDLSGAVGFDDLLSVLVHWSD